MMASIGIEREMYGLASEFEEETSRPLLRRGSRGRHVAFLQNQLNRWLAQSPDPGLTVIAADGDFGEKTDAAVRAFQSAMGLTVDGVVGPITWNTLNRVPGAGDGRLPDGPRAAASGRKKLSKREYNKILGLSSARKKKLVRNLVSPSGSQPGVGGWREYNTTNLSRFRSYFAPAMPPGLTPEDLTVLSTTFARENPAYRELPPEDLWPNMKRTLLLLRDIGDLSGTRFKILSAYRSDVVNALSGGVAKSAHMDFSALDVKPLGDQVKFEAFIKHYWHQKGKERRFGLGFYRRGRIHIDARRFRRWGSESWKKEGRGTSLKRYQKYFGTKSLEASMRYDEFEMSHDIESDEPWDTEIRRRSFRPRRMRSRRPANRLGFGGRGRYARPRLRTRIRYPRTRFPVGRRPGKRPGPPRRGRHRHRRPRRRVIVVEQPPAEPPPPEQGTEYIRWVQTALNQILGRQLLVNGIAGPETRAAVREFQGRHSLPVNGIVGPRTEQALVEALSGQGPQGGDSGGGTRPTRARPDSEFDFVEREWQSEVNRRSRAYIAWVQKGLNKILGLKLAVDGVLGPKTRSAVRRFQQQQGLAADGLVGPRTEQALVAAGAGKPPVGGATIGAQPATSLPSLRNNIVRLANQEWLRWHRGRIKEGEPGIRRILVDYWQTGAGWRPKDPGWWSKYPWSAAFISWIMRKAGAGKAFRYSAAHAAYIKAAKDNRLAGIKNPFKAYRINERKPEPGDLVCKRRAGSGATYDNIRVGYKTHCDIVTKIQPGRLTTIGGNVSNSVSRTYVTTGANGYVDDPKYFALVKLVPSPP
jgi:peptidoglycan hydrolase-like protein with peptidoglycan-binding domain